jgi:hypothetical protein
MAKSLSAGKSSCKAEPESNSAIILSLFLGSGLTDQSQKMTVAARAMAEKKALGHRS